MEYTRNEQRDGSRDAAREGGAREGSGGIREGQAGAREGFGGARDGGAREGFGGARDGAAGHSRDGHSRDRRDRNDRNSDRQEKDYIEKLVKLNRTAKVVKGGRRFSFSALCVVGDKKGKVGWGFGKANDVSEAIRKSIDKARRNMISIPVKNGTIPHSIQAKFKSSKVLLKPACSGTGIIAGAPVRAIMEASGVTDVLSKSIGASSQYNVVKATFQCIERMLNAKTLAKARGKLVAELWN